MSIQVHWEFGDYAESYRVAARQVADARLPPFDRTTDVALPTLFLYRHAIELALKDAYVWTEMVASTTRSITPAKSVDEIRDEIRGHELKPLLEQLRERFDQLDSQSEPAKPTGLHNAVAPAVAALDQLDIDGQRLRYPYLTRGRGRSWSSDSPGPSLTSVGTLASLAEGALDYLLDTMGSWLSEAVDQAIADAWLDDLWNAERRYMRVAGIQKPFYPDTSHLSRNQGTDQLIDDIKAEESADLLLDIDD